MRAVEILAAFLGAFWMLMAAFGDEADGARWIGWAACSWCIALYLRNIRVDQRWDQ